MPDPAALELRVAGAQIEVSDNVSRNLSRISRAIAFAAPDTYFILNTTTNNDTIHVAKGDRRSVSLWTPLAATVSQFGKVNVCVIKYYVSVAAYKWPFIFTRNTDFIQAIGVYIGQAN